MSAPGKSSGALPKKGSKSAPAAPPEKLAGRATRRAVLILAIALPAVIAAVALPKLLTGGDDDDEGFVAPVPAVAAAATSPAAKGSALPVADDPEDEDEAEDEVKGPASAAAKPAEATPPAETSPDGDLALGLKLRWREVPAGDRVLASLRFTNHSQRPMHVAGADEPHPTLAVVVGDAEGNEVRRIIESGHDQLPRRLELLRPGASCEIPVAIVDTGEQALPAGEYVVLAEFRPDPALLRVGLPVWMGEKGTIRSEPARLVVTAR